MLRGDNLGREDFDAMIQIINQNDSYTFKLVLYISSREWLVRIWMASSARHRELLFKVTSYLVSYCKIQRSNNSTSTSAAFALRSYNHIFQKVICQEMYPTEWNCIDAFNSCQRKIEELHSLTKGDLRALEARFDLLHFIKRKCQETESSHEICIFSWVFSWDINLLFVLHDLTLIPNPKYVHITNGLICNYQVEDEEAILYLRFALKDSSILVTRHVPELP